MTKLSNHTDYSWDPVRLVRAVRRRFRLWQTDLSSLQRFVLFVGNPRSGTTLVRSLLNAHPEVLIANEVDVLRRVQAGESWRTVTSRILQNEYEFSAKPVWTGYDYSVRSDATSDDRSQSGGIRVIGDKKAGASAKRINGDWAVMDRFTEWSRFPGSVIHCIRHPFDVISTKARRNGESLNVNIDRYFQSEMTAVALRETHPRIDYLRVYQEDLVHETSATLTRLLQAIGLDVPTGYMRACEDLVYERPNRSRFQANWTDRLILGVERRVRETPHLHRYLTNGRLLFDEEAGPTNCSAPAAEQQFRRSA